MKDRHGYLSAQLWKDGKKYRITIHRLLAVTFLGATTGQFVDHRNRITTDNRLENLRVCSKAQNQQNAKKRRTNTSGFIGVSFDRGKYVAKISVNGKQIYLGRYKSAKEAARVRDATAIDLHGAFASLN